MTENRATDRDRHVDSQEIDGFRPTREELEVIARHWAEKELDDFLFHYLYGVGISGHDHAKQMFQLNRLNRVAKVIGDDAVADICKAVNEEERKKIREQFKATFEEGVDDEFEVLEMHMRREERRRHLKREEQKCTGGA